MIVLQPTVIHLNMPMCNYDLHLGAIAVIVENSKMPRPRQLISRSNDSMIYGHTNVTKIYIDNPTRQLC